MTKHFYSDVWIFFRTESSAFDSKMVMDAFREGLLRVAVGVEGFKYQNILQSFESYVA